MDKIQKKHSKYNNKFSKFTRSILINHYEWCKKEGRKTDWYKPDSNVGPLDPTPFV